MLEQLHLDLFVFDDGLDDEVAVRHGRQRAGRAEACQGDVHLLLLQAADGDAPLHDLHDVGDPLFESRRRAIEQHGGHAAAHVGVGDARAHETGPDHADALDGLRLDGGIGHAGILLQPLRHEEDADQIAANGACRQRQSKFSISILSPSSSGKLQPRAITSTAATGAGYCPWVVAATWAWATVKRKACWSSLRPTGCCFFLRALFQSPGFDWTMPGHGDTRQ